MRLRRVEPILRRALRGPCLLPEGSRLLVAVSGGADSTALLVALVSVAREFGLSLAAAHVHHGLRGAEADGDLEHARALCGRLGVPFEAARIEQDPAPAGRAPSEERLRVLRRGLLEAAADRAGAAAIATAHTADDQLETVLMRLARGTGLAGLGGMRPGGARWLKPLLEATRHEVELDLRAAGIEWREDSSNAGRAYLRNRLRHDVVPALVAAIAGPGAGPLARARLARRAAATAADARAGAALARRLAAVEQRRRTAPPAGEAVHPDRTDDAARQAPGSRMPALPAPRTLQVDGWAALETAVRHALIVAFWRKATEGSAGPLHRRHRDAIDALLLGGRTRGTLDLPGGWVATLHRPRLRIGRKRPRTAPGGSPADGKLRRAAGPASPSSSREPSARGRGAHAAPDPPVRSR